MLIFSQSIKNSTFIKYCDLPLVISHFTRHFNMPMKPVTCKVNIPIIENYKSASKKETHRNLFSILQKIKDDLSISQSVRDIAQTLLKKGGKYITITEK